MRPEHTLHPPGQVRPRCLVIVPAFNERASIAKLVSRLHRALPNFDVLVVDDGSSDGTADHVPASVALVRLPFNLGIGAAMQTGYRYALLRGYDVAIQCDGDGQHRPSQILPLVDHLLGGGCDFVVGSRFLEGGGYHQTFARRAGGRVLSMMIRLLSGLRVTDCTSGFRVANRRVIEAFAHWYPEDYPEPEVLLLLKRSGFSVCERPVRMRQRRGGRSSLAGLLAGPFYIVKVSLCLVLDLVRQPWPMAKVVQRDSQPPAADVRWSAAAAGRPPAETVQA